MTQQNDESLSVFISITDSSGQTVLKHTTPVPENARPGYVVSLLSPIVENALRLRLSSLSSPPESYSRVAGPLSPRPLPAQHRPEPPLPKWGRTTALISGAGRIGPSIYRWVRDLIREWFSSGSPPPT